MKVRVYSIKDELAGRFGQPFCLASDEMAQRQYRQMMSGVVEPDTYVLFCLGVFDDETGVIDSELRVLTNEPNSRQAADSPAAHERTSEEGLSDSAHDITLAKALDTAVKNWRK